MSQSEGQEDRSYFGRGGSQVGRGRGGFQVGRVRARGRGRVRKQPGDKSADQLDKELETYHAEAMNTSQFISSFFFKRTL